MARGGTTDLFGQLDQLGELVVCLCAELGILLRKVLHELRVAGRDLGAQLGVPVHTKVNLVNQKNLKLFNVNCVYIFFQADFLLTGSGSASESGRIKTYAGRST